MNVVVDFFSWGVGGGGATVVCMNLNFWSKYACRVFFFSKSSTPSLLPHPTPQKLNCPPVKSASNLACTDIASCYFGWTRRIGNLWVVRGGYPVVPQTGVNRIVPII